MLKNSSCHLFALMGGRGVKEGSLNIFYWRNKYNEVSTVDSGGAGGARAPPEFRGSEKGRSLISAYRTLAITTNSEHPWF